MDAPITFARPEDPPPDSLPETWVDRYTRWASEQTDAPSQYHEVNAITTLSTVMCPFLIFRTSYGSFKANIWSMILAGTTLTRKSTTMTMAINMLHEVHPDFLMATEGSPEGLLSELSHRNGKIALFHRDEIAGWIESTLKRDYLGGMMELFCKIYDGGIEKRVLRKEAIEVTDPNMVIMSGGIKTKMEEIITMDHIRSGFLPRFIIVTGNTKLEDMRPIGPPRDPDFSRRDPREEVLEELYKIVTYYTPSDDQKMEINGVIKMTKGHPTRQELTASNEVWNRIAQLKHDAMQYGVGSTNPEIYSPLYDRLSNSVIKVAMLLAGARQSLTIELTDLYKAIYYSDKWVQAITKFAESLETAPEMDKWEKKADKILEFIKKQHPQPVTKTDLMRRYRVKSRDIEDLEKTLVQRGQIRITRVNNGRDRGRTERTEYTLATAWNKPEEDTIVIDASKRTDRRHRTRSTTIAKQSQPKASPREM